MYLSQASFVLYWSQDTLSAVFLYKQTQGSVLIDNICEFPL